MIKDTDLTECENCGLVAELFAIKPLEEVDGLAARLSPGEEVPAGECRACGCLAYLKYSGSFKDLESTINYLTLALEQFAETVDVTGGITEDALGLMVPNAAQDWPDLAQVYIEACTALARPVIIDGPCEG